jgi:hypothetical protein
MTDEQALFLGDILPTGWMAAANCEIEPTDIVAIWVRAGRPVLHQERVSRGQRSTRNLLLARSMDTKNC